MPTSYAQISSKTLAALFDQIYPASDDDDDSCLGGPVSRRRPQAGLRFARELVDRSLRAADALLVQKPDTSKEDYYAAATTVFENLGLTITPAHGGVVPMNIFFPVPYPYPKTTLDLLRAGIELQQAADRFPEGPYPTALRQGAKYFFDLAERQPTP